MSTGSSVAGPINFVPMPPRIILARIVSADPAQISSAEIASAPVPRTVGQQLLLARSAAQVARILPRARSAAESLALFHFGT